MIHAGIFTLHAGIYDSCWYPCWYLRFMLVFTIHVGIYDACWYLRHCWYLHFKPIFTTHAGIYDACGIYDTQQVFMLHAI